MGDGVFVHPDLTPALDTHSSTLAAQLTPYRSNLHVPYALNTHSSTATAQLTPLRSTLSTLPTTFSSPLRLASTCFQSIFTFLAIVPLHLCCSVMTIFLLHYVY